MIKADKPEVAGGRSRNEADRCHRGSAGHYRSAELGPGRNLPSGSGGVRIRHEIWRDVAPKLGCVWAGGAGGAVSGAHLEVDSAPLAASRGLDRFHGAVRVNDVPGDGGDGIYRREAGAAP